MSETSGFFQAVWDSSLTNPITNEATGWWDRSYLAKEFMEYFSLFVGNGVFISPTNQLLVKPGTRRSIIVLPGWAFINGGWYHNDAEVQIDLDENTSSTNRVDSIRVRYSSANREITLVALNGEVGVTRGSSIYDLELARVTITPKASTVTASNIVDKRPDESVCGFVKGLVEVIATQDLFSQFTALFEEWFNGIKDQVTGDLAIRLQLEFDELKQAVENYQAGVNQTVASISKTAQDAYNTMNNFVNDDFVLPLQELVFVDKQCIVVNEKVTADSLIDVYFTKDTMPYAESAMIYVDSEQGRIVLTAEEQPTKTLNARIRVRVK